MTDRRVTLYIEGKVQGVSYRAATVEVASGLGLNGYVANLDDGRVKIVAEGTPQALETLKRWCHSGPPAALVDGVRSAEEPASGEFKNFGVR